MANMRTYEVLACKPNGILLGGTTAVGLNRSFVNAIQAYQDGLAGAAAIDAMGKRLAGSMASHDIIKWMSVFGASAGALEYYLRESGLATCSKWVVGTTGTTVITGGQLTWTMGDYFTCGWNFQCRFGAAQGFQDLILYTKTIAVPTLANAIRLRRITAGLHASQAMLHITSLSIRATPEQVLSAYGDDDEGETAVDVGAWQGLDIEIGLQDTTKLTGPPTQEVVDSLLDGAMADLVLTAQSSGDAGDYTLTAKNVTWTTDNGSHRRGGYTEHRIAGKMAWLDADGIQARGWITAGAVLPILTIAEV